MTAIELVALGANKIRKNEELMRLYIGFYEDAFSFTPNCAPCTFNSDFNKLKKYLSTGSQKSTKPQTMETRKHVLNRKFRNQIFTYKKDGRPYRSYGYLMTDEFAEAFIAAASDKKEKDTRKAMFDVLPSGKETAKGGKTKNKDAGADSKKEKAATGENTGTPEKDASKEPEADKAEKPAENPDGKETEENTDLDAGNVDSNKDAALYIDAELRKLKRAELDELLVNEGLKPEDYSNSELAKEALLKL